jgi:hypothetical protein
MPELNKSEVSGYRFINLEILGTNLNEVSIQPAAGYLVNCRLYHSGKLGTLTGDLLRQAKVKNC